MNAGNRWSLTPFWSPTVDRLESQAALDGTVDVAWMTADSWWQVEPPDLLGYQWRSPGTYVIATDHAGIAIASVKINYVHRPDGNRIDELAAAAIAEALLGLYNDEPAG